MGTDALAAPRLRRSNHLAGQPKLRIDLVTRGAQPAGRDDASASWSPRLPPSGCLRVILSEHPNFACRGIDLPPTASESDDALL